MNTLRLAALGVLLAGLACGVRAAEKADNKKLIVGAWEMTKGKKDGPPVGSTFEFIQGGKLKFNVKEGGKEINFEGTYAVDGDKLTVVAGTDKETVRIKTLNDKELVLESKGDVMKFKRKK